MTSLDASNINKPVEKIRLGDLVGASVDDIAKTLQAIVDYTATDVDNEEFVYGPISKVSKLPWIEKLLPGLNKLTEEYHCGNFVVVRGETRPFFESMPLYARLAMDLQFYLVKEPDEAKKEDYKRLLRDLSKKQGEIFDSPDSKKTIPVFMKTYSIQSAELLQPNLAAYKNLNEFFYRQLRPDARPIQNEDDSHRVCSMADSRLTVYPTTDMAKEFWIKGHSFTIAKLLNLPSSSPRLHKFNSASVAVFRLSFGDYHRFHCPVDCVVRERHDVSGEHFTVNPQSVNEAEFDTFTCNKRSVLHLTHLPTGLPLAIVAVGSLLLGSINWTGGMTEGKRLTRGSELGYFAYGGSTVIAVFPKGFVQFDEDLVTNSEKPIETLVKVGYSIGKTVMKE